LSSACQSALAADLAREPGITVAVETGTFGGGSTRTLASIVERVISIELSQDLHDAALRTLADLPNVTLLHGSSSDVLPGVVSDLHDPAIYWLDGHWCEGASAGYGSLCPVLDFSGVSGMGDTGLEAGTGIV
jgi:hypothetical protein